MLNLQVGMVAHAKKLDLHDSNGNVYSYNAPGRGQKFTVLVIGVEDPKALKRISADEFLRKAGWTFDESPAKNKG